MAQEAVFARQCNGREEDFGWAAGDVLHGEEYHGIKPPERENRKSHSQQS